MLENKILLFTVYVGEKDSLNINIALIGKKHIGQNRSINFFTLKVKRQFCKGFIHFGIIQFLVEFMIAFDRIHPCSGMIDRTVFFKCKRK